MTAFLRCTTIVALCAFTLVTAVAVPAGQTTESGDLLTSKQVKELVANAKTSADHIKLSKHFLALAAKYESDAADHVELASLYRKSPGPGESKRPSSPDTAIHCDRFSSSARDAAKEARELATAHEHLAAAK